jgi:hypothetical protein
MKIVEIVSRDTNHANRLFDANGVEYSHPLALNIPELPFKGVVNNKRRMVTGIVVFESGMVMFQTTYGVEELIVL